MFGFDPAHTPQLELSLKGGYNKAVSSQRYIAVPNAFDWVDTNGDGLGDLWTISGGTPSIVTVNGFAGRAQRLDAGATARTLRTNSNLVVKGSSYRLRFRWRAGVNLQVRIGTPTFLSLGANTGNAVFYDGILKAGSTSFLQFQISSGDYLEVSEIELWEITAARIWDEGRNRSNHGILFSGKAFQFNGISSYVDCGNASSFQVTTGFTAAFWIKLATNGKVILSKDDNGSNRAFQIMKDTNGKLNFITIAGSTVSTLTESTATIDDEIWHRVVCTYNGTTKAIYVDGKLSISSSLSGAVNNASVNVFIGKTGDNSSYLSGALSDVQLWSKGLDSADIIFDFEYPEKPAWQRTGTSLTASDLKGNWWMCENTGYYAFDYSGNRNDGVLYGVAALSPQKDIPQFALISYSQKLFGSIDTVIRGNDTVPIRNIWNNGGKLHLQIIAYSDGESDLGTIITKTKWLVRCEAESAGKVKLRFIVLFSVTNGEWVTTNTEVTLKERTVVEITYNSASSANVPVIKINGITVALTTASAPSGTYSSDSGSVLYVGDTIASATAFDGIIDNIELYNTTVLKAAWNNTGVYQWLDLSGNNNPLTANSNSKEIFILSDPADKTIDFLGLPISNPHARYGINLDSNVSYMDCSISPSLTFNASTDDFSVSVWVKLRRPVNSFTHTLVSLQNSSTSGFFLMIDTNLNLQSNLNALKSISVNTVTDTNWHFVVCTVKRNDKMKLFLDGTEVTYSTQDNLLSEAMTVTSNIRFGSRSYSYLSNLMKAELAGITLHRKILSTEEQTHLYAFGKSGYTS